MWKRFWAWPRELKERGVLGINARNLFINQVNSRALYPRVDDKTITKEICRRHGIAVPKTYAVIERLGDIEKFFKIVAGYPEFVIKPSRGAGGRGILVVDRHDGTHFETPGGTVHLSPDINYRLATILSGVYSLSGLVDKAIVEKRIRPHTVFGDLAVSGTPDIRVILYRGDPVMAMLRLPTEASRGRANLHQGAVGVGIDFKTGLTCGGVYLGRAVTAHPDTGQSMQSIAIPHWPEILSMASCLSNAIELGYLGVDVVLDIDEGPLVLEANARPGLAVQIANFQGLAARLERIGAKF